MMLLRQSTSVDVPMGPMLDETDGKTAETALTITQADIRLKKNGGNWAQKNAAQTLTHEENGWYELTLDATDTDTIGHLMVAIHESGALPVWREFHVLAPNVYDSLFGAATDKLQVDVVETNGTAVQNQDFTLASGTTTTVTLPTTYSSGNSLPDDDRYEYCVFQVVSGAGEGLILLVTTATANPREYNLLNTSPVALDNTTKCIVLGGWRSNLERWRGTQPNTLSSGRVDATVGNMAAGVVTAAAIATGAIDADAIAADAVTELRSIVSGTADSGTTTTMVDAARTEADTDYWKGCYIHFTSGNIAGQVRLITGFTPGTDTITFAPATTQAVGTNTYEILPAGRADVGLWNGTAPNNLNSGRVDSHTGNMANDVITASVIATDAIDADAIAANAIDAAAIATGAITAAKFAAGAIDAAALASDAATEIADAILTRNVSNVEGTAGEHTLCTVVLACLEYSTSGTTWTIKRTDGTTTHATKTLTTNASAEHITGVT